MNLLWLESAINTATMTAWVARENKKYLLSGQIGIVVHDNTTRVYDDALNTLSQLHIVPSSGVRLALNPTFKSSFRQALTGG